MPLVVPRYTLQDLESFPGDGSRYELLDGVLLVAIGHQAGHLLDSNPPLVARCGSLREGIHAVHSGL